MAQPRAARQIPLDEARDTFGELLSQAETGEVIEIVRHGRVIARLTPGDPRIERSAKRVFGFARGEVAIGEGFEEPLDDFSGYR